MEYLYKNGIMNNEADGDDMPGFKGILARWLSKLVYEENQSKYFAWMEKNADSAWLHRNTQNLMWTAWEFPTNEFPRCAWGCSAAVAQQFACLPYKNKQ